MPAKSAKQRARLDDDNPDKQFALDILHKLRTRKEFSFHKPDNVDWDFRTVYAALNRKSSGFTKRYTTDSLRQLFKKEIVDWVKNKGAEGKRPDFEDSNPPAASEEKYSPESDASSYNSDGDAANQSDESLASKFSHATLDSTGEDNSNDMPSAKDSSRRRKDNFSRRKDDTDRRKNGTDSHKDDRHLIQSGEDMTWALPYRTRTDSFVFVLRVLRTEKAQAKLEMSGQVFTVKEIWPIEAMNSQIAKTRLIKNTVSEVKVEGAYSAISTEHSVQLKALGITDDSKDSEPLSDFKHIKLPVPCKPYHDRSQKVEKNNGLYVIHSKSDTGFTTSLLIAVLRDKSSPYVRDKKAKEAKVVRASRASLGGRADDDNDDDSDFEVSSFESDEKREELRSYDMGEDDINNTINNLRQGGRAAKLSLQVIAAIIGLHKMNNDGGDSDGDGESEDSFGTTAEG